MRVRQQREVRDAVADLLLRPVAAPADDVRAQALLLQRLLVEPQRARRADEQDDVALRAAGVDLGAQPCRDRARLGAPPRLRRERVEAQLGLALLPPRGLAGEQLDARLLRRIGREQAQLLGRTAGDERREPVAQHRREGRVHDVEDLRSRPEVDGQASHPIGVERGPAGAEDADVRVPEAVDRLRLVADREQVPALERLEHVELQPVRVLELVDHDECEALGPSGAQGGIAREQVAHAQLQVVEVDARPVGLGLRVCGAERVEQRVEQDQHRAGVMVGARGPVRGPRVAVGDAVPVFERLRPHGELGRVERAGERRLAGGDEPLARLQRLEPRGDPSAPASAGGLVTASLARRGAQRRGSRRRGRGERRGVGSRRGGRDRQAWMRGAAAAQRGVRERQHRLELAAVRGREVEGGRAVRRGPRLQGRLERAGREPAGGRLVEHREPRVQARGERLAPQHAGAEPVDRADPRRIDLPRVLGLAQLDEPPPDPLAQLRRRLLGERQRQDRADGRAVVQDCLGEALDHHGGLAGAGAGREERGRSAIGDRRALLGRAPHSGGTSARGSPARQMAG